MTPDTTADTLGALFQDDELRLTTDSDGWEGFQRRAEDGETAYFYVDTRPHVPELRREIRVSERAVRETVRERLDPEAELAIADGGQGR